MNGVGVDTGWRMIIHGPQGFFSVTRKMHNALQGENIRLTDMKTNIYEEVGYENSVCNHL